MALEVTCLPYSFIFNIFNQALRVQSHALAMLVLGLGTGPPQEGLLWVSAHGYNMLHSQRRLDMPRALGPHGLLILT